MGVTIDWVNAPKETSFPTGTIFWIIAPLRTDIAGDIEIRAVDTDTGEVLASNGFSTQQAMAATLILEITMPNKTLNVKIEAGTRRVGEAFILHTTWPATYTFTIKTNILQSPLLLVGAVAVGAGAALAMGGKNGKR